MSKSIKIFEHKLGTTRAGEGTRLWLEGKRLIDHGFTYGAHVERKWSDGKLVLRVIDEAAFGALPRDERTTVSGKNTRPIIDVTGERVRATFPTGRVQVAWSQGRIVVIGI